MPRSVAHLYRRPERLVENAGARTSVNVIDLWHGREDRVLAMQRMVGNFAVSELVPSEEVGRTVSPHLAPPIIGTVLASSAQALDSSTRSRLQARFDYDLGQVRIHADDRSAESARAARANAYTVGRDVVFGAGKYEPDSARGRALLVHELTHVGQQGAQVAAADAELRVSELQDIHEQHAEAAARGANVAATPAASISIQRQMGELRVAEHREEVLARLKLDYAKAKRQNQWFARDDQLGWATTLTTIAGGAHKAWAALWTQGKHDEFADAIAAFQFDLGFPERELDGVLGPRTWFRIAGLGPAMASIVQVNRPESENICYEASEERMKRGVKLATGKSFELPEDRTASLYHVIMRSIPNRMLDVDVRYRGTGAAGALVYAGLGDFVTEAEIWAGGLRPGAALQVWGSRAAYDLLVAGEVTEKGKKRRVTDADANYYGTSLVFVGYDPKDPERVLVRHFGSTQWNKKSDFEVWLAANPR